MRRETHSRAGGPVPDRVHVDRFSTYARTEPWLQHRSRAVLAGAPARGVNAHERIETTVAARKELFSRTVMPRDCTFTAEDWTVLSSYWHPVAFSHDVGATPIQATLLDQDLVVYRTSSGPVVAKNICLHRGAQLTLGRLDGDELVCRYHGWRYGADGQCTLIPSQSADIRISPLAKLFTYPVQERYGLIWTCLSGEPAAELPDWPEAEDPTYRWLSLPPLEWTTSSAREVDNFLDTSHFGFVHAQTLGRGIDPVVPDIKVERTAAGLEYQYAFEVTNPADPTGPKLSRHQYYYLTLPFSVRIWQQYPEKGDGIHLVFNASSPVSARFSRTFFFVCQNHDFDVPEAQILARQSLIMGEDQMVVESQRPEELPLNLHDELHVKADRSTTAYRRALKEIGLGADFTA